MTYYSEQDECGTIQSFAPMFIPYYAPIKDDYRQYILR